MATGKHDDPPTEATLERMLTEVGPLLRRRAAVGAPDPAFVTRLRARLLKTGTAPVPAFAHFPRGHPTRRARGRGAVRAGLVNDQPATSPLGPPRSPRHASEGEKTRRTRARGRARKPRGPRRSQWRRLRLALDVSVTTNARALAVRAWLVAARCRGDRARRRPPGAAGGRRRRPGVAGPRGGRARRGGAHCRARRALAPLSVAGRRRH